MFLLKEYHRAAHLIRHFELEKKHAPSYNLLLESLYESNELNEAVAAVNSVDIEYLTSPLINQPLEGESSSRLTVSCEDAGQNVRNITLFSSPLECPFLLLGIAGIHLLYDRENLRSDGQSRLSHELLCAGTTKVRFLLRSTRGHSSA